MRAGPFGGLAAWLAPLVVWALLVGLAVSAWAWTGGVQRAEANQGFAQRAQVGAAFTRSYLTELIVRQQQDAEHLLGGRTISQRQFDLFSAGGLGGYTITALHDGQGRLIVGSPARPGQVGRDYTGSLEHIRLAEQRNRVVVSNVYRSPAFNRALVAIAVPFPTPYGRRIFAGGFVSTGSLLGEYLLSQTAPPIDGRSYYVDEHGNVVATTVRIGSEVTPLSRLAPRLAGALDRRPAGEYRVAGRDWRYTSARVGSTPWRLVTETPKRRLYAGASRAGRRFAVVLLVAAVAGLGGALIVGAARARRRHAERQLRLLNLLHVRQAVELRNTNDRLESVISELESFSSSVAHDLRAPLRAMSGYSEILMEDHATADPTERMPEDEVVGLLRRIQVSAAKMAELIDALLAFSRLQRQEINTRTVDLTALAREAWDDLSAQRSGRDIRFDLAELPPCKGDPVLLRQVMINLLDNAIKFTRDRPTSHIEVGGRPAPEGFSGYFVRDNGAGFDPTHADQLFKPFHRLHPPGSYEGIGVGLSLVHRIIARHSGRISAESVPGEQTTFSFTLPGAEPGEGDPAEPEIRVGAQG